MKAILTITPQGIISLPPSLRAILGLKANDRLLAETTSEGLLLKQTKDPMEVYTEGRIKEFDDAEGELESFLECR